MTLREVKRFWPSWQKESRWKMKVADWHKGKSLKWCNIISSIESGQFSTSHGQIRHRKTLSMSFPALVQTLLVVLAIVGSFSLSSGFIKSNKGAFPSLKVGLPSNLLLLHIFSSHQANLCSISNERSTPHGQDKLLKKQSSSFRTTINFLTSSKSFTINTSLLSVFSLGAKNPMRLRWKRREGKIPPIIITYY